MKLNIGAFFDMIPLALEGWLGVIVVIAIIALVTYGSNAIFSHRR